MKEVKPFWQSKIVVGAVVGLILSVVVFFTDIQIPAEASAEFTEELTNAIIVKDWAAAGTAVVNFLILIFRLFFTTKKLTISGEE